MKWQPALAFLPEKFQGQRSLAGYVGSQRAEHDGAHMCNVILQVPEGLQLECKLPEASHPHLSTFG